MFLYKPLRHDSRVLQEARTLGGAGYEVLVVASHMAPTTAESSGRVRVLTVNRGPRSGWLLWGIIERTRAKVGRTSSRPQRAVGQVAILAALATYGSLAWWRYLLRALRAAASERADLYVAHDLETLPVAVAAKMMSGGQLLYDSHELYTELPRVRRAPLSRRRWSAIERALIGRADRVMTVSETLARLLHDRYGIALPCVLLNVPHEEPITDATAPDLRAELGISHRIPIILHLGYLQPDRGLEQLISTMPSCPETILVLMGEGQMSYVSSLKELVQRLQLSSRVRFVPLVAPEHVIANSKSADVGVVLAQPASLSYYGSLPNKLFQYLAAGLPVVASHFPELNQIVSGYDVGVTCDPSDPRAIADAIHQVIRDPVRHEQLRSNALATAETFNWATESAKLLEVVGSLTRK